MICCRRSDHCWSHGRGSDSASFQAGSCSARQRASRDSSTPSISIAMRHALFSGCSSVSPSELTWTPYRKRRSFGSSTPYRSRQVRSHSSAKARILHSSSTNRRPALQKNETRPTAWSNSAFVSVSRPRSSSSTSVAVESA